mmetsp:Transcript_18783/g.33807  ORF Transcript_18783/g.33807 Transcript_18783/m.33807 type:complete len:103 (-) Transcript_18783:633-941(-)
MKRLMLCFESSQIMLIIRDSRKKNKTDTDTPTKKHISSRAGKLPKYTDFTTNATENSATHQSGATASNASTHSESAPSSTAASSASTEAYPPTYVPSTKYAP